MNIANLDELYHRIGAEISEHTVTGAVHQASPTFGGYVGNYGHWDGTTLSSYAIGQSIIATPTISALWRSASTSRSIGRASVSG